MKKILKHIAKLKIIMVLSLVFGCSEKFLDEPKPTDQVSSAVIYSSRAGADAFMAGILRRQRGQFTSVDAAGLNSMLFARSMKGNDVIQSNNWFGFDYENDNREPTYRRTTFSWNYPYYMIGQLNQFIIGVEESSGISTIDKNELIGQAKALRGYYYHQLVLEFCPTYSFDTEFPAPPIYTAVSLGGNPMTTVGDMYDFIVADLTDAVSKLSASRLDKSFVNLNVANAFLAQVYQVMGDWPNAEIAARAAYGGNTATVLNAASYDDGFNDLANVEWIWGLPQYSDQTQYYYSAPHVMTEHYVLSYQATFFNDDFVNLFSATDVRKNVFEAGYYGGDADDYFYWITTKFAFTFDADIPVIRTPEMILIEAEAKFHNSDPAGAHDLLYALQLNRDASAVKSSNTGNALLQEILLERRKELFCENGIEWFDAKRTRTGITRTGNHRIMVNLAPDDNRFFLKIPQGEIDANENIDETVNVGR